MNIVTNTTNAQLVNIAAVSDEVMMASALSRVSVKPVILTTSYPGSFLYAKTRRKDPGRGWSRGSQILGAELKIHLGRGGRGARVSCLKMLRLKLINLCVFALFLLHKYIEEIGYAHHYNDLE